MTSTRVPGRGELRRVVEQLGEEVGDVGRGVAEDVHVVESGDVHSGVVLDLTDRGTHDVAEGDGLAPAAGRLDAGQHEQRLGVATHAGGEVVELEQVLERVGIGLGGLELIEEADLTVEQALVAPSEVDEQLADALAEEVRLLDGDRHGRLLDGGERLGEVADLVLATCVSTGVITGTATEPSSLGLRSASTRLGKLLVGHLVGGGGETAQRAGDRPADEDRRGDRERRGREREERRRR